MFDSSIGLTKQLGMEAVAEGVEDGSDWEFVQQQGCDIAQGFYIAEPMPAAELTGWIRSWQVGPLLPACRRRPDLASSRDCSEQGQYSGHRDRFDQVAVEPRLLDPAAIILLSPTCHGDDARWACAT